MTKIGKVVKCFPREITIILLFHALIGIGASGLLGGEYDGKAALLALVSKEHNKRVKAGDLVNQVAAIVGGKGGGRPDMAQAGGSMPDKLEEAIAQTPAIIARMLG